MKNVEIPAPWLKKWRRCEKSVRVRSKPKPNSTRQASSGRPRRRLWRAPAGLELRRMQIIIEVGAEQNNMMIIMMPSEFVETARAIGARSAEKGEGGRV
jgi:hypothetical protein